jgi:hypothetical protein
MLITETKTLTQMPVGTVYLLTVNGITGVGHTVALNYITDGSTYPVLDGDGNAVTSTVDFQGTFVVPSPDMEVNVSGSTEPFSYTLRPIQNKTA